MRVARCREATTRKGRPMGRGEGRVVGSGHVAKEKEGKCLRKAKEKQPKFHAVGVYAGFSAWDLLST